MFKASSRSIVKGRPANGLNKRYNKHYILIQLYGSQRTLAERQTNQTLEKCHCEIADEVAALIASCQLKGEAITRNLAEARFAGTLIEDIDLSSLILEIEHQELHQKLVGIISSNIMERFRVNTKYGTAVPTDASFCAGLLPMLNDWLHLKKKSLQIVHELEKCGKKTLNKGIGCVIQSKPLFELAKGLNFSTAMLQSAGISAKECQAELCSQLSVRLSAFLHSYQLRMTRDYQQQAARIFYQLHDEILDHKLVRKIQSQENWLASPVRFTAKEA